MKKIERNSTQRSWRYQGMFTILHPTNWKCINIDNILRYLIPLLWRSDLFFGSISTWFGWKRITTALLVLKFFYGHHNITAFKSETSLFVYLIVVFSVTQFNCHSGKVKVFSYYTQHCWFWKIADSQKTKGMLYFVIWIFKMLFFYFAFLPAVFWIKHTGLNTAARNISYLFCTSLYKHTFHFNIKLTASLRLSILACDTKKMHHRLQRLQTPNLCMISDTNSRMSECDVSNLWPLLWQSAALSRDTLIVWRGVLGPHPHATSL